METAGEGDSGASKQQHQGQQDKRDSSKHLSSLCLQRTKRPTCPSLASAWSGIHRPRPGCRVLSMAHTLKELPPPSRLVRAVAPLVCPQATLAAYVHGTCKVVVYRSIGSASCLWQLSLFLSTCPWPPPLACPAWLLKLWCLSIQDHGPPKHPRLPL